MKDSILELYIDFILDFISRSFLDIVMSLPRVRLENEILVYNQGQAKLEVRKNTLKGNAFKRVNQIVNFAKVNTILLGFGHL